MEGRIYWAKWKEGYKDRESTNFVFLGAGAARRRERVNLRM